MIVRLIRKLLSHNKQLDEDIDKHRQASNELTDSVRQLSATINGDPDWLFRDKRRKKEAEKRANDGCTGDNLSNNCC